MLLQVICVASTRRVATGREACEFMQVERRTKKSNKRSVGSQLASSRPRKLVLYKELKNSLADVVRGASQCQPASAQQRGIDIICEILDVVRTEAA